MGQSGIGGKTGWLNLHVRAARIVRRDPAVCSKWAEYQVAKVAEQSNLPSQQEREDMRGYITAHRTRYLRRMANKRRR